MTAPAKDAPMGKAKPKALTYTQIQYVQRLKIFPDARITNRTATALEKLGIVEWRYDNLAPWGGEWVLVDGSTPSSNRGAK